MRARARLSSRCRGRKIDARGRARRGARSLWPINGNSHSSSGRASGSFVSSRRLAPRAENATNDTVESGARGRLTSVVYSLIMTDWGGAGGREGVVGLWTKIAC